MNLNNKHYRYRYYQFKFACVRFFIPLVTLAPVADIKQGTVITSGLAN